MNTWTQAELSKKSTLSQKRQIASDIAMNQGKVNEARRIISPAYDSQKNKKMVIQEVMALIGN